MIAVLDGDTVLVRRVGGLLKIRLAEIDAPEKAQASGETSKRSLSDMVMGKQVKFVSEAMDQYGRMVAHLSVDGLDVNAEQIRRGMAWAAAGWRQSRRAPTGVSLAGKYSSFHSNKGLVALQREAMQVPRGLWAQSNPTPPWEWRKLHPSTKPGAGSATVQADPPTGCGEKKHCSQMTSCKEARFYQTQCGVKSLDGDGDGMPCESLCTPQKKIIKN